MTARALITIADLKFAFHLSLDRHGEPAPVGSRLLEAAAQVSKFPEAGAVDWVTALIRASEPALPPVASDKSGARSVRLIPDWKIEDPAPFRFEIAIDKKKLKITALKHQHPDKKTNGANEYKQIFEGNLEKFVETFKVAAPDFTSRDYVIDVISDEGYLYQRVFRATAPEYERLQGIVAGLTKAKAIEQGTIAPLATHVPAFSVGDMIGQLADLCGEEAVKLATAPPKSTPPKSAPTKPSGR